MIFIEGQTGIATGTRGSMVRDITLSGDKLYDLLIFWYLKRRVTSFYKMEENIQTTNAEIKTKSKANLTFLATKSSISPPATGISTWVPIESCQNNILGKLNSVSYWMK